MSKRRAVIIPPIKHEGEEFHVSQDRRVYRLDRHGNRRVKGPEAIRVLDQYDRQMAAIVAFNETLPPEAREPVFAHPDLGENLAKEAPEWA